MLWSYYKSPKEQIKKYFQMFLLGTRNKLPFHRASMTAEITCKIVLIVGT